MAGGYRENKDSYSDMEEEQGGILSMLLTLAALIVMAVIVCTVVWMVSHREPRQDVGDLQIPNDPLIVGTLGDTLEPETSSVPEETEEDVEPINGDVDMPFDLVDEEVTAKDVTTLRSVPSTDGINTVVGQLVNGQTLKRVGINKQTGWSKLIYRDQEVFAVTYTVTKDLDYKPENSDSAENRVSTEDGRVIIFIDCDDMVTAKEVVNLRTEPSTTQGTATVRSQLSSGEEAHRTGISPDSGWSRVEYNGMTLYVVSSYIQAVD